MVHSPKVIESICFVPSDLVEDSCKIFECLKTLVLSIFLFKSFKLLIIFNFVVEASKIFILVRSPYFIKQVYRTLIILDLWIELTMFSFWFTYHKSWQLFYWLLEILFLHNYWGYSSLVSLRKYVGNLRIISIPGNW